MRVLISGAGVAGPTVAYFLAKTGARISIVDKAPALLPHGQNIDVEGSAITVLKKMELLDEVRRYYTTEKGGKFYDREGRSFAPFPADGGASPTSELEILRGDLAKVIYGATKDHPNVDYQFGTAVKQIISNDENAVKVELSNGKIQEYDLLVAADGQWSKLRKQCFSPESIKVVDKHMYVVYFTIPRIADDDGWWNCYLAPKSKIITIRPDPHGTTRAMFTCMPCDTAQETAWRVASRSDRFAQEKLVRQEFWNAGWQAQRLLDAMPEAPDFYFHPLQQIKMDKWSTGRVVCLGDAAWAPTPLTGAGAKLAITGAYVLAGELSKLNAGEHPARALDAFDNVFHPFVEKTQHIYSIFPGIMHPEAPWKRWLLEMFMRVLATLASTPLISNRFKSGESNVDGFKLPPYSRLDDKLEK